MPFDDPCQQQCANPVCPHVAEASSRYCTGCDQMLQDWQQDQIDTALEYDQLANDDMA